MQFDTLLKGGHLIDPGNHLDGPRDLAITAGKVAAVDAQIPEAQAAQVLDKIEEEIAELRAEIDGKGTIARQEDEIGDLFFALANLARHLKIDPESALRHTNAKFERRFRHIETRLDKAGRSPMDASLEEMESFGRAPRKRNGARSRPILKLPSSGSVPWATP